jgi:hypothetical protein
MSRATKAAALCLWAAITLACGQTQMVRTTARIRQQTIAGNYDAALATLRQSKHEGFKEQDRVAFWMNEGMLLHLTADYKSSNEVLHKAERRAKELFTRSYRKDVKAAFTSDAALDYRGEDYERVLINVIKALNFLGLGDKSGALVEARKINEKLKLYNTKYKHKNVYNQDAFAHWMMGLLFEMEGSYDDARIAYVHAMEVYQDDFAAHYGMRPPSYVAEDIVRAALLSGAQDIADDYRSRYGDKLGSTADALEDNGEIILVHLNGEGPSKSDYTVTCWFRSATTWACDGEPGGEFIKKTRIDIPRDGTVVKVAFPELHIHDPANPVATLEVAGARARTEVALPVSRIAVKTMADKMHRVFKRAIVRAITKTLSSKAAGKVGQAAGGKDRRRSRALGWLAEKATSATLQAFEEADKRAWTTLPARIEVARAIVPPGTHDVQVKLSRGRSGVIKGVKVEPGKRVVITYRTIP